MVASSEQLEHPRCSETRFSKGGPEARFEGNDTGVSYRKVPFFGLVLTGHMFFLGSTILRQTNMAIWLCIRSTWNCSDAAFLFFFHKARLPKANQPFALLVF